MILVNLVNVMTLVILVHLVILAILLNPVILVNEAKGGNSDFGNSDECCCSGESCEPELLSDSGNVEELIIFVIVVVFAILAIFVILVNLMILLNLVVRVNPMFFCESIDSSKSGYSVEFCDLGESGDSGKSDTFDKSEMILTNLR